MKRIALLLIVAAQLLVGCRVDNNPSTATVVWISVDGFRHDYLSRFNSPALSKLAHTGAFTNQERPIFPSLTFPNHVAQVTGTTADKNGIPMNAFFDPVVGKEFSFPDESSELRDEPIWVTAKRQGLRVMTIDWPMSHNQTGPWASDYFPLKYDSKQSDSQRLDHVVQLLNADAESNKSPPLRLIMTYISHVDTVGHRNGPDSNEVENAVREADSEIDSFVKSVVDWFDRTHQNDPNAELYVLITTDHGMEPVHTHVNLDRLIGVELVSGARIITSGPNACVYLNDPTRADAIVEKLRTNAFLRAWKSADVPPELHFADASANSRIGQVVVCLNPGYTFTSQRTAATLPATRTGGMHGYDPAQCSNMLGTAIVWRYRHPLGGVNLGQVDNTQWDATVCHLLGIKPAQGSDQHLVDLARK